MLRQLETQVQSFLRDCRLNGVGGEAELKEFVGCSLAAYDRFGHVKPLDADVGVPTRAAQVDTVGVLLRHNPGLAQVAADPATILLRDDEMPDQLPRPFIRVAADYDIVVGRLIKAGLQEMVAKRLVAQFRGKPIIGGTFAVGKPGKRETRMISAVTGVNAMINPRLMPRPRFPNVVQLAVVRCRSDGRLRVSKRDVRHFFHQLRNTPKWRAYLAHPPPKMVRRSLCKVIRPGKIPVHRAWPMGHALSATLAQAITDGCAVDAGLLVDERVVHGALPPPFLPAYGLCMDDGWAIDEDDVTDVATGQDYMEKLAAAWSAVGLEENTEKRVDARYGEEVQGYYVHPDEKWVGLAVAKRIRIGGTA